MRNVIIETMNVVFDAEGRRHLLGIFIMGMGGVVALLVIQAAGALIRRVKVKGKIRAVIATLIGVLALTITIAGFIAGIMVALSTPAHAAEIAPHQTLMAQSQPERIPEMDAEKAIAPPAVNPSTESTITLLFCFIAAICFRTGASVERKRDPKASKVLLWVSAIFFVAGMILGFVLISQRADADTLMPNQTLVVQSQLERIPEMDAKPDSDKLICTALTESIAEVKYWKDWFYSVCIIAGVLLIAVLIFAILRRKEEKHQEKYLESLGNRRHSCRQVSCEVKMASLKESASFEIVTWQNYADPVGWCHGEVNALGGRAQLSPRLWLVRYDTPENLAITLERLVASNEKMQVINWPKFESVVGPSRRYLFIHEIVDSLTRPSIYEVSEVLEWGFSDRPMFETMLSINSGGKLTLRLSNLARVSDTDQTLCYLVSASSAVGLKAGGIPLTPDTLVFDDVSPHEAYAKLKELASRTTFDVSYKLAEPVASEGGG